MVLPVILPPPSSLLSFFPLLISFFHSYFSASSLCSLLLSLSLSLFTVHFSFTCSSLLSFQFRFSFSFSLSPFPFPSVPFRYHQFEEKLSVICFETSQNCLSFLSSYFPFLLFRFIVFLHFLLLQHSFHLGPPSFPLFSFLTPFQFSLVPSILFSFFIDFVFVISLPL